MFNVSQAEFGVLKGASSDEKCAGYAWINSAKFLELICKYKSEGYRVIVFAHCGLEEETVPMPEWINVYHNIVDVIHGPVIATHPHIIQGEELYHENSIFYSLGNFIFQNTAKGIDWNRGLVVSFDSSDNTFETRFVILKNDVLSFDVSEECRRIYKARSRAIVNQHQLDDDYDIITKKYWNEVYEKYYYNWVESAPFFFCF